MKQSSISFIFMLLCITTADAQKRYVIVDMEIGVPQRDVRVRWGIKKLLTYKKRRRQKKAKEIIEGY